MSSSYWKSFIGVSLSAYLGYRAINAVHKSKHKENDVEYIAPVLSEEGKLVAENKEVFDPLYGYGSPVMIFALFFLPSIFLIVFLNLP